MPTHNLTKAEAYEMREVLNYIAVGAALLWGWSVLLDFIVALV